MTLKTAFFAETFFADTNTDTNTDTDTDTGTETGTGSPGLQPPSPQPCAASRLVHSSAGAGIRLCIVEDDADLREELSEGLLDLGFEVRACADAAELQAALNAAPADLVLLDVMLPGEDGFSIAATLRSSSDLGIVMLTGRSALEDRVHGLLEGADAYLCKPVALPELVATLISVHRRRVAAACSQLAGAGACAGAGAEAGASALGQAVAEADWSLSRDGWLLHSPCQQAIALTRAERCVLRFMFERRNRLCTRQALAVELAYPAEDHGGHRLDMLFSRLRSKVRSATGKRLPLVAVRGQGFMLRQTPGGA